MKMLTSTFAVAVVLTFCGGSSAQAQDQINRSIGDFYNDYELHVAEYQTNWYSVVTWRNGTTSEYRSSTEQGALDWALWLYLHIAEVRDIDVVSRVELGEWVYIDTFGTYFAASVEASFWGSAGYETDIRAVRVNWITPTPNIPITKSLTLKK